MSWFNDLSLRWKLFSTFGVVLLLLAVVSVVALRDLAEMEALVEHMYKKHTLGLSHAMHVNEEIIASTRDEKAALLATDPAEVQKYAHSARTHLAQASEYLAKFQAVADAEELKLAGRPG